MLCHCVWLRDMFAWMIHLVPSAHAWHTQAPSHIQPDCSWLFPGSCWNPLYEELVTSRSRSILDNSPFEAFKSQYIALVGWSYATHEWHWPTFATRPGHPHHTLTCRYPWLRRWTWPLAHPAMLILSVPSRIFYEQPWGALQHGSDHLLKRGCGGWVAATSGEVCSTQGLLEVWLPGTKETRRTKESRVVQSLQDWAQRCTLKRRMLLSKLGQAYIS